MFNNGGLEVGKFWPTGLAVTPDRNKLSVTVLNHLVLTGNPGLFDCYSWKTGLREIIIKHLQMAGKWKCVCCVMCIINKLIFNKSTM